MSSKITKLGISPPGLSEAQKAEVLRNVDHRADQWAIEHPGEVLSKDTRRGWAQEFLRCRRQAWMTEPRPKNEDRLPDARNDTIAIEQRREVSQSSIPGQIMEGRPDLVRTLSRGDDENAGGDRLQPHVSITPIGQDASMLPLLETQVQASSSLSIQAPPQPTPHIPRSSLPTPSCRDRYIVSTQAPQTQTQPAPQPGTIPASIPRSALVSTHVIPGPRMQVFLPGLVVPVNANANLQTFRGAATRPYTQPSILQTYNLSILSIDSRLEYLGRHDLTHRFYDAHNAIFPFRVALDPLSHSTSSTPAPHGAGLSNRFCCSILSQQDGDASYLRGNSRIGDLQSWPDNLTQAGLIKELRTVTMAFLYEIAPRGMHHGKIVVSFVPHGNGQITCYADLFHHNSPGQPWLRLAGYNV